MENFTLQERELYEALKELRESLLEFERHQDKPVTWPERVDKAFQRTDVVLHETENKAASSLGSAG
ncbi:hypothetical protein ACFOW6_03575 [Fodinicurvata halophila]|uniref:Uncharacterized protein n=1 Tax=Fodinicurvata halophila TaxID=1419723 RepID=A0ABV8UH78_9PROT